MHMVQRKERLDKNYSGFTISSVLDGLLGQAVYHLSTVCNLADCYLSDVLSSVAVDRRRKISTLKQTTLIDYIFTTLVTTSPKIKAKYISRLRLERTIYSAMLTFFDKIIKNYPTLEYQLLTAKNSEQRSKISSEMYDIEQKLSTTRSKLGIKYRAIKFYWFHYIDFRDKIAEKYVRLAEKRGKIDAKTTGLRVSEKDLIANYFLITVRALNKYSSEKGTDAEYVKKWFMHARSNPDFEHQIGTAYDVPSAKRRRLQSQGIQLSNFSESLEVLEGHTFEPPNEVNFNQIDFTKIKPDRVALATCAKSAQVAIVLLGLPYKLKKKELYQMNRQSPNGLMATNLRRQFKRLQVAHKQQLAR